MHRLNKVTIAESRTFIEKMSSVGYFRDWIQLSHTNSPENFLGNTESCLGRRRHCHCFDPQKATCDNKQHLNCC